jgi:hypothetical protein
LPIMVRTDWTEGAPRCAHDAVARRRNTRPVLQAGLGL